MILKRSSKSGSGAVADGKGKKVSFLLLELPKDVKNFLCV